MKSNSLLSGVLSIGLALAVGGRAHADDFSIGSARLRSLGGGRASSMLQLVGPAAERPIAAYWVEGAPRNPVNYFRSIAVPRQDYSTFPPRQTFVMVQRLAIPVEARLLLARRNYGGGAGLPTDVTIDLPARPESGHVVFVALDRDAASDGNRANNIATVSLAGPELEIAMNDSPFERHAGGNPNRHLRLIVRNNGFLRSAGASVDITLSLANGNGTSTRSQSNVRIPDLLPGQSHELRIAYHFRADPSTCLTRVLGAGDLIPANDSRSTLLR